MRGTKGLDLCFEKVMAFGGVENMMNDSNNNNNLGSEIGGGLGGGLRIIEWKDIPVELLLRILSLVDDRTVIVASGVCHGWRDAISWGLTHLSLSWCKKHMNDLVLSLIPKFTKLEVLILRQDTPQLQDDAVEKIATHCHDLQELDLSKSFRLTDRSLYAVAHGCPNLVRLNISGCSAFNDTALAFLTGFCRKLKFLNLCGCVRAASDRALKAIGYNCNKLQSFDWMCDRVGDEGVKSLAYGCPDLTALDLCGCVLITDDSVIALANNCLHLRSLDLYYCQNITDQAMYSLAQSRVKNKPRTWASVSNQYEEEGLTNLNISQCTALTPPAVQAVCDSFPALHTCPGRHSLIISGCLSLTSVHCACAIQAHHAPTMMPHLAH
ncbi:F-box protein SKP2A [Sesamum angolense]|uniref:F-box protein SKP2A n=1 Tax=Sesamum angolense TaxID=2727404 RepID=A0AAE2BJ64_9LAMI|nr:F-box protein SKP2A [Sesamum angolense]